MRRLLPALLLILPTASVAKESPKPKPPLLVLTQGPKEQIALANGVEARLMTSKRYRLVPIQGLVPLMRQADNNDQIRQRAGQLVEEGRKSMVALEQATAQTKLKEARDLLHGGFVRYYDPRALAQVHLLLGVIALEQLARPDLARQELVRVHHLDPTFTLDAHYSPTVRAAFQDASRNLPPRPTPPAEDLKRLAELAKAKLALVLTIQPTGDQSLVQGSLFVAEKGAFTTVESRLVEPADAARTRRQTTEMGDQLLKTTDAHYPAPKLPKKIIKKDKPFIPPPPPPPKPWYRRWYTWTAVGVVVVAAAIILPLTLQTETSDVVIRW